MSHQVAFAGFENRAHQGISKVPSPEIVSKPSFDGSREPRIMLKCAWYPDRINRNFHAFIYRIGRIGPLRTRPIRLERLRSSTRRHARPRLLSCPSSSWHPSPRRMGRWQSRVRVGTSDHTWSRIWSSTAVSAHALASNHPSSSWRPHLSPVVVSDSAVDSGVCVALHRFDAVAIVTSHCLCAAVPLRRKIPSAPACATRAARTARPTCSR